MKVLQISFFLFLFSSCEESAVDQTSSLKGISKVTVDQKQFEITWENLQSDRQSSDPFKLKTLRHEDSILFIDVAYSGGCSIHNFELVWPEVTTMIYPPRYTVVLMHGANDDSCEAYLSETLQFDLSKYELGLSPDVIDIMDLTIINGSNPDESLKLNN
ncbi:MAG: hypothetical protein ABJF04_14985 [Reichenbachiella sp.]|uniref:hypothetical protein n=1 Tax=Reichenbachiella sp. TaxID=2184521 RepID=UPI0032636772